jgi:hypothetical protein
MKKTLITLIATERLEHVKCMTLVVPDDCTSDDLIMLGPDWLNRLSDGPEWEIVDSDGMETSGIEIDEPDPDDPPDVWLRWGRDGLEEYDPEENSEVTPTES